MKKVTCHKLMDGTPLHGFQNLMQEFFTTARRVNAVR